MGYYMRFISTDEAEITTPLIKQALQEIDPRYTISDTGELKHDGGLYGLIEINLSGDELFDEELSELREDVAGSRGKRRNDVLGILDRAKAIVAVQVLWQGRGVEPTLEKLDPLWNWLFNQREGLQQADGEGYYDGSGQFLKV